MTPKTLRLTFLNEVLPQSTTIKKKTDIKKCHLVTMETVSTLTIFFLAVAFFFLFEGRETSIL